MKISNNMLNFSSLPLWILNSWSICKIHGSFMNTKKVVGSVGWILFWASKEALHTILVKRTGDHHHHQKKWDSPSRQKWFLGWNWLILLNADNFGLKILNEEGTILSWDYIVKRTKFVQRFGCRVSQKTKGSHHITCPNPFSLILILFWLSYLLFACFHVSQPNFHTYYYYTRLTSSNTFIYMLVPVLKY